MSTGNPYNYSKIAYLADIYENNMTYVKSFQVGMGDFVECEFSWSKHGCQEFVLLFSAYQDLEKTQIVKIRLENTTFFCGIIREISEYADTNGNYVYAGYGLFDYIEKGNTTQKTFVSSTIYDMIEWFIDAIIAKGKPIVKDMTKIDVLLDTYIIDVIGFQNESIDDAFDKLRKIANGLDGEDYIYGVDENRKIFFTARSTTVRKTLSVGTYGDNGIAEYRPSDSKEEVENVFSIGTNALFYDEDGTGSGDTDETIHIPALSDNDIDDFIEGEIYDLIRAGIEAKIKWKIEDESPLFLNANGVMRIVQGDAADTLLLNEVKYKITNKEKIREIRLGGIEVPETENGFLLRKMKKADINIGALRSSTTIAINNIASMGRKQNYVFGDSFDSENSFVNWTNYEGNGEMSIINSASSLMGGNYAEFGNNAGNDMVWLIHNIRIPFNPNVMYRIRCYASRTNGTGTVYLGVAGFDKDKVFCNTTGANSYSSQHYFAALGKNPGAGTLYTGYFRGNDAAAGGEHTSIFSPGYMYTNVKYFSPLILVNYDDQTGKTQIFYFTIEVLPDTELNLSGSLGCAGADLNDGGIVNVGALGDVTSLLPRSGENNILGYTGSGSLASPSEGDRRIRYYDGEIYSEEYTGGAWSMANGLKLFAAAAAIASMVMGCGLYNPNLSDPGTESFPGKDYRIFNFENNYEDQLGNDDWVFKTNCAFSSSIKKFGTYSLFATINNTGLLQGAGSGTLGESQTLAAYFYLVEILSGATGTYGNLFRFTGDAPGSADAIVTDIYYDTDSKWYIRIRVVKTGVTVYSYVIPHEISTEVQHYVGFVYDSDNDIVITIIDNTQYNSGILGGSWETPDTLSLKINSRNNDTLDGGGPTVSVYIDEFVYAYDMKIDPDILIQHYNHGIPWETNYSQQDTVLIPGALGRCFLGGPVKVNDDTWYTEETLGISHKLLAEDRTNAPDLADATIGAAWETCDLSALVENPINTTAVKIIIAISSNDAAEDMQLLVRENGSSETDTARTRLIRIEASRNADPILRLALPFIVLAPGGIFEYSGSNIDNLNVYYRGAVTNG